MWSIRLFKLFDAPKALALVGLLVATLAAGCAAGPGYSGSPYGYSSGYGTAYPYNSGYGGGYYPYNGGYGYSGGNGYNGGYQNPYYQYQQNQATFNQQYQRNQQIYNQQYQKNLQTYKQHYPNNPVPPRPYPIRKYQQHQ
jgi:hypothetical protein